MKYLLIAFLTLATISYSEIINIVTEEYPLYNFTDSNGKLTGLSTEVVEAVIKEAGLQANFKVYPWKRAYETAQDEPNTLIYSIGRNAKREDLFKWVGVIAPYKVYFYKLAERNDIVIKTLDDAKKFKVGTTIDDARQQYLISKGFEKGKNIEEVGQNELNVKKLFANRIDLLPVPELVIEPLVKKAEADYSKVQKVFELSEISSEGLYMAFGKKTSDEIVKKCAAALEKIKKNGTYDKIQKKYHK